MDKKKSKLTISGIAKKSIESIEKAKTQSKNSVVIGVEVFGIILGLVVLIGGFDLTLDGLLKLLFGENLLSFFSITTEYLL